MASRFRPSAISSSSSSRVPAPRPSSATSVIFASMGVFVAVLISVLVLAACSSTQSVPADAKGEPVAQPAPSAEDQAVATHPARAAQDRTARQALSVVAFDASPALAMGGGPTDWNTERYDALAETGFTSPLEQPRSTFSIDVDTASYSNVRRFLHEGQRPPRGAVRIEELVNYFRYPASLDDGGAPFGIETELFEAPWAPENRLVRITVRGREIAAESLPARNLVFLIDVSGSMQGPDRLGLIKKGMAQLVEGLRPEDRVSMVVYAGASGLVLPPTPGSERGVILGALESLSAGGSTHGAAGIRLAYETARANFDPEGINRVILATDGDFNVGVSSRSELTDLIEKERESGVFLTVLGFGRGNLNDAGMEELADRGNGNYAYLDSAAEARKVLVQQAGSTLVTIAKDVKIQVEFNPARVGLYRLIGYENRRLEDRDFNDDRKDAGEIGAGHHVTALYEIVPADADGLAVPGVDPLKYQRPAQTRAAAESGEWLMLKLRYKEPQGSESRLVTRLLEGEPRSLGEASENGRFTAAVALFGMLLQDSEFAGQGNFETVRALARASLGSDERGERAEFLRLVALARELPAS